jgi:hypothetical protein
MSNEDPRERARVQEILAQRAMVGAGISAAISKPSVVEAAKTSTEPRAQEILAQRQTVGTGKSEAVSKVMGVAQAKPGTEPRTYATVDMKSMEKLMGTIDRYNEINKGLLRVEKELYTIELFAKILIGLGAVGVVIFLRYVLYAMYLF